MITSKPELELYINGMRPRSEIKRTEVVADPLSTQSATLKTDEKPASSGLSSDAVMDYTKGGIAVVQGMFDALQKQKQLESEMMSDAAVGKAASSQKRYVREAQGTQNPLRELMAAYRPR